MGDVFTKKQRSEVMSKIKSKGNKKTELRMIQLFKLHHITGWRRHLPLPGKPDFSFPKKKTVVFIDGCFWHGCPKCFIPPKSNVEYWEEKIANNKRRDRRVARQLRAKGWRVFRIWEHEIAKGDKIPTRLRKTLIS